jgi:hypothetical protein
MSGHHPFSNLTKHFTPEDWKIIEEMKSELRADIERRKSLEADALREDSQKANQPQPAN